MLKILLCAFAILISSLVSAATYELKSNSDIVGELYSVESERGDTLLSIGLDYEMGYSDMKQANPGISTRKRLKTGTDVIIPSQFILPPKRYRHGIVLNMAELRLYYFPQGENIVITFPVAMGKAGWRTPTKTTAVKSKTRNPTWYVPTSIREYTLDHYGRVLPEFIPPGPSNPLGRYAIYLEEKGILIHGTNNAKSIGKLVSSGCIRMHNQHVKQIFERIEKNTPVHIIHHAHKFGFDYHGTIYIESHPLVSMDQPPSEYNHVDPYGQLNLIESENNIDVHMPTVHQSVNNKDGMPQPIGQTKSGTYPDGMTSPIISSHLPDMNIDHN